MKKKLLDYLFCPDCHCEFQLITKKAEDGEIIEGSLLCSACNNEYPIKMGIPRILKRETDRVSQRTSKNFGYSWTKVWKLSNADELEFNSYFAALLKKEDFKDKLILDAGCGSGRFTYFVGLHSTKDVIGFDFSNSVESAFEITRRLKNVHIVQADIYNLPLKKEYELIYSIGVLHHLPRPQESFNNLVSLLVKNGQIFAWVYGKEGNRIYLKLFEPFRAITCQLPLFMNNILSTLLAGTIWIIIKLIYLPCYKRGFVEKLPLGKYLMFFYRLGFKQFRGTVFDKMIPPIANYYTEQEFRSWFQDNGLKDIKILERTGNSWRGVGRYV